MNTRSPPRRTSRSSCDEPMDLDDREVEHDQARSTLERNGDSMIGSTLSPAEALRGPASVMEPDPRTGMLNRPGYRGGPLV